MIFNAIISVLVNLFTSFINLLPAFPRPAFLDTAISFWGGIFEWVSGLGGWIPLGAMGTALLLMFASTAFAIAVRIVRIVMSAISGGGGSAA